MEIGERSGRHQLAGCYGLRDDDRWQRLGSPPRLGDAEELLADPAVELVIVAGGPSVRPAQLRRAVRSQLNVTTPTIMHGYSA